MSDINIPTGGWRDGDAVVETTNIPGGLYLWRRAEDDWTHPDDKSGVQDSDINHAIEAGSVVYVHTPRENAHPEPAVAPLPSEDVACDGRCLGASDVGLVGEGVAVPDHRCSLHGLRHVERQLDAALAEVERLRRLVPEDDEDTVRVPREAVEAARSTLRSRGWTLPPAAVSAALAAALPHRHLVVPQEALDVAVAVMADAVYAKTGRPADLSELENDLRRAFDAAMPYMGWLPGADKGVVR